MNVEKIGADGDIEVVCEDRGREGNCLELGNVGRGRTVRGTTFEVGNVRAIDGESPGSIGRSDGTVVKKIIFEDTLKIGLGRAA